MIHLTSIGVFIAFINIYDFKRSNIKLTIYFLIAYTFLVWLTSYIKMSPLYSLNIINAIITYKITKKAVPTIIIPLMSTLLYIAVNILCYYTISLFVDINIYKLYNMLYITLYYLITYCIVVVIARFLNKICIKNIYDFEIFPKFRIQALTILTSILSISIYFETKRQIKLLCIAGVKIRSNGMLLLLYFITFLSFIFLIMLINNQKRLNEISQYNKKLEGLTNEMKKFRHDYKNIMLSMNGYLIENDIEGLKKFFYSNIAPSSKVLDFYNLNISSIANINCIEVKGIIFSKIIKAEDIGIDTKVYIPDIIDYINFNCLDLCRVLGIILDNCIEAGSECESPSIEISITKNDTCVSIITTNTYINKGRDISKFFKEGFSTKGDGRGIGLSNLKEILSNYDNAYFTIKAEDEFIQKLDIYN